MKKILFILACVFIFASSSDAQRVAKYERYKFEKTDNGIPGTGYYITRHGDTLIYWVNSVPHYLYPVAPGTSGITETTTKAFGFYNVTAQDSALVFEVRGSGYTISEIRAIRTGGTSVSINCTKNGNVDLLTANYAVSTSMGSAGTLQNNTLADADQIRVALRAISGTLTEIFIQFTLTKTL